MKNEILLDLAYEAIWLIVAAVASIILIYPIYTKISQQFLVYLCWSLFLVFTYVRGILFMQRSIIFRNVFVKILLFVLNIVLFIFVLNQYYSFNNVFDVYNYTLPVNEFQHIKSGTEVDDLLYIKKLTIFSGIVAMILIVLMEMRLVHAFFKYRQLDKYI
ncbi:MAG: hypothetical protein KA174_03775 [Chitinophagales bacterium]|nr:hypothetical protein [Chitinophagales bacterium]